MSKFSLICRSARDTAEVAAAIAPWLHAGDAIMLKGSLAAGKTTFVQALVAALGSEASVTSPTFTLAHFYSTLAGTVVHVDAYRLSSVAEYRDLGLEDYMPDSIAAVEWGDKVEQDFPHSLSIVFEFANTDETTRTLTISSSTERWAPVLRELRLRLHEHIVLRESLEI